MAALAVLLLLVTAAPYAAGRWLPAEGSRFNEALIYESDFNVYNGYVRQAVDGLWLFRNPLTPEPHTPAFFNLEFLVAGRLADWFGLEAGRALQGLGAVAGVGLCFALHRLSLQAMPSPRVRLVWLFACLTGGGLGWLTVLPAVGPVARTWGAVDRYAGLHPFFWLLFNPHFVIAGTLTVLALGFYVEAEGGSKRPAHLWAALLAAVLGVVRPFDALFLAATAAVHTVAAGLLGRDLFSLRSLLRLSLAWGAAPVLLYNAWLFRAHPVFRWFGRLNVVPSPPLLAFLTGLGLVLVPFVATLVRIATSRRATPAESVLLAAVVSSVVLLGSFPWLTFSFQFATTLLVPLSLLAAGRLDERWVSRPALAVVLGLALCVNSLTSVFLYARAIREVRAGAHRTPVSLLRAFAWLQDHAPPDEVVVAAEKTGNRLPRYTRHTVIAGSPFTTVQYDRKLEELQRFYSRATGDGFRHRLLDRYQARYVLHGPEERALGAWDPRTSPLLQEAFTDGDVTIYRVAASAGR